MRAISLLKSADIDTSLLDDSLTIHNICCDSREVNVQDLFVAIPCGHALQYAQKAIKAGAKIIVAEKFICEQLKSFDQTVFFISSSNPRLDLAKIANAFYDQQPQTIVAVTGTNGKSSIVNMLRQFWYAQGEKSASLGSLGLVINPDFLDTQSLNLPKLNSLDAINFHKTLAYLKINGVDHLAMEASSHGLDQARLHRAHLTAAGFTNLTQDHLDYHHTMDKYFVAKSKLFTEILSEGKTAVLNADSPYFSELKRLCKGRNQEIISYSIKQSADLTAENIRPIEQSICFDLRVKGELISNQVLPLVGHFQLENLLCAIGLGLATGTSLSTILSTLPTLKGVAGRMEFIGKKNGASVFVDYSHTPDALECALKSLRSHSKGKLWVVFGCGGDRDAGKRPLMGEIAGKFADKVIVTDDNPRFEEPTLIRQKILEGCPSAQEIGNRAEAIAVAIAGLKEDDVLLIAGKGHESGQIIGNTVIPFSDQDEVLKHIKS
jgi:UDP-N-acetylmuramoyl-L-alanyl-D-glutamate--2,6-diaminopimelate ligase